MEVRLKRDGMRRKGDTGAAEEEQQGVESFPEEERGEGKRRETKTVRQRENKGGDNAHRTQAANVQDATRSDSGGEGEERKADTFSQLND